MVKYKPGQFVKVQNLKGLYRMKINNGRNLCLPCLFCDLHHKNCGYVIDCFKSIGSDGYLEKVK